MKKKKFNTYQTPAKFMTYMSRLENKRQVVVTDDHYVLQNAELLRKYRKSRSESAKEKIRETLFWVNIKYLHEIFMKKLNPNLFKDDALDIYQELCVYLVKGIDSALKKDVDSRSLSFHIYGSLMSGVDQIIKNYFERGRYFEELIDPDDIEYEYPEVYEISHTWYQYLDTREKNILTELYYKGKDTDEVGLTHGITRARVHQIRINALKKMREASDFSAEESKLEIKFRQDIFKILKQYPKVHWVIFEDPGQSTVNLKYLERHGINPSQFLIISKSKPIEKSYYNRIQYKFWIPKQYYGHIFDWTLEASSYDSIWLPFKYDIRREMGKIFNSFYVTDEDTLRSMAIESIYKRELLT